jgi:hypothetical protein
MYDMELDRKKCQRAQWLHKRDFVQYRMMSGLSVETLFTEVLTDELRTLLEYAIKGIGQELQEMDEANERQAALDDFETGIRKALWSLGSYEKIDIDDFFDDDTIKTIRAALQTKSEKTSLSSTSPVRDALSSQTEAACAVRVPVIEILETVLEQAEDEGLWFNAKYASEAYLQQELRRLHAVIERAYAELSKTQEPSPAPPQKEV